MLLNDIVNPVSEVVLFGLFRVDWVGSFFLVKKNPTASIAG